MELQNTDGVTSLLSPYCPQKTAGAETYTVGLLRARTGAKFTCVGPPRADLKAAAPGPRLIAAETNADPVNQTSSAFPGCGAAWSEAERCSAEGRRDPVLPKPTPGSTRFDVRW
jgi:hypothetical protein